MANGLLSSQAAQDFTQVMQVSCAEVLGNAVARHAQWTAVDIDGFPACRVLFTNEQAAQVFAQSKWADDRMEVSHPHHSFVIVKWVGRAK